MKWFDLDGHQTVSKLPIWESRANSHESRPGTKSRAVGAGRGKKERALLLLPPSRPSWLRLSLAGSLAARKLDVHITELFVSTESLNFLYVLYAKVYRQFSLAVERKCCHVMSFFPCTLIGWVDVMSVPILGLSLGYMYHPLYPSPKNEVLRGAPLPCDPTHWEPDVISLELEAGPAALRMFGSLMSVLAAIKVCAIRSNSELAILYI